MIAGVDFNSSVIDVVLLDQDTDQATWHRIRLDTAPGDAFTRARRVRDAMPARGRWKDEGVILAAIEEPRGPTFKGTIPLLRVQGAILACLPASLPVVELTPQRWKIACGLRGNASKQTVADWARAELQQAGLEGAAAAWPQDALDAYAIARAGRELNARAIRKAA